MSLRRSIRPPIAKLTLDISCSELKAPETLIETNFVARLNDTCGSDDVLRLQSGDQCAAVNAQTGELLHREVDEDLLVLRPKDLDLGDIRHAEELRAASST